MGCIFLSNTYHVGDMSEWLQSEQTLVYIFWTVLPCGWTVRIGYIFDTFMITIFKYVWQNN